MQIEQFQWTSDRGWNRSLQGSRIGSSAQLVLLFGRHELVATADGAQLVRRAFPNAHVVGCTTGGEIQGARVSQETLTVTAVTFEHSRVAVAWTSLVGGDGNTAAGEALVRQLEPKGLRHLVVYCEGRRVDGSAFVRGIAAALPGGATVSGGFAADGNRFGDTHVWCDGPPQTDAALAIGFYGERLRVGMSVTGGWGPFGPDRVVTRSERNIVHEFDGQPALALYKRYLGEYAEGLPAAGLMFPLEVRSSREGEPLLRVLLAVDEATQSITYAGDVPEGSLARFMVGHIEDLIGSTFDAARRSLGALPAPRPELSLIVSCNARRAVLKQRLEEEVEAVQHVLGTETAIAGFYSYGEIGPHADEVCELHNETMTITNFAEV